MRLAAKLKFELVCACPQGFEPDQATADLVNNGGAGKFSISHDVYDVSPPIPIESFALAIDTHKACLRVLDTETYQHVNIGDLGPFPHIQILSHCLFERRRGTMHTVYLTLGFFR